MFQVSLPDDLIRNRSLVLRTARRKDEGQRVAVNGRVDAADPLAGAVDHVDVIRRGILQLQADARVGVLDQGPVGQARMPLT